MTDRELLEAAAKAAASTRTAAPREMECMRSIPMAVSSGPVGTPLRVGPGAGGDQTCRTTERASGGADVGVAPRTAAGTMDGMPMVSGTPRRMHKAARASPCTPPTSAAAGCWQQRRGRTHWHGAVAASRAAACRAFAKIDSHPAG